MDCLVGYTVSIMVLFLLQYYMVSNSRRADRETDTKMNAYFNFYTGGAQKV